MDLGDSEIPDRYGDSTPTGRGFDRGSAMTAPRPAERWIPRVSGSKWPAAWGHCFGPGLRCDRCNIPWSDHMKDPHECRVRCRELLRENENCVGPPVYPKISSQLA